VPNYVLDETVIDQINRGSESWAQLLGRLLTETNAQVWMTNETYRKLPEVDKAFVKDVGIRVPATIDNYRDRYWSLGMLDRMPSRSQTTAALAFHLDAELLTMNGAFRTAWRSAGGKLEVPPVTTPVTSPINYNQARRAFHLEPVVIAGDRIVPAETGPGAPPRIIPPPGGGGVEKAPRAPDWPKVQDGPRTAGGALTTGALSKKDMDKLRAKAAGDEFATRPITAKEGEKLTVQEYGPSVTGEHAMAGGVILLQGVNLIFRKINGDDNQERFEAAKKRILPDVTATLNDDPSLGALLIAHYSPMGVAGEASQIEARVVFRFIQVSYGRTRYEAKQNIPPSYEPQPPGSSTEEQWIPPKQPVDVSKLPTPFRSLGLATFAAGRTKFINVGMKYAGGFYEYHGSKEVNLPAGSPRPQFLILEPPETIQIFYFSHWINKDIDVKFGFPREAEDGAYHLAGNAVLPHKVLDLGGDTYGTMVYPADKATERLIRPVPMINDKENLLRNYDMKLIRCIELENLRVIDLW
jgi:hypothetical protein